MPGEVGAIARSHERRLLGDDFAVHRVAEAPLRAASRFAVQCVLQVRPPLSLTLSRALELGVVREHRGEVAPVGGREVEQPAVARADAQAVLGSLSLNLADHVGERADATHEAVEFPRHDDIELARSEIVDHAVELRAVDARVGRLRLVHVFGGDLPLVPATGILAVFALSTYRVSLLVAVL